MTRDVRLVLLACAFFTAGTSSLSSQGGGASEEYRLKAAFVSRFPQFVEWPAAAIDASKSLQICVSRPNPFGDALRDLVAGETLNGRPIVVREIESGALDGCHVLFVANRGSAAARAALDEAATRPLLTIGESSRFLDDGGIINLRIVDRRVRFEVNAAAAGRAGLRLSSQLLRLAIAVRGTPS